MAGTDDKLLTDFVAGDPEAFVELYRRHLPAVLDFFLRRAGDPELAADLTAETFAVEGGWRTRLAGAWRSSRWRWTTRCLRLQQDAVRAYLPQVPAPRRAPTLRLATRLIAFDLALISRVRST